MIFLRKPEPHVIRHFLDEQITQKFSYTNVGATGAVLPTGFSINHTRNRLGHGQEVFQSACRALRSWQQLQLGWVDCWPHNAPLRAGENIAVIGRAFGLWWLNACRVAYVMDDPDSDRFGYAHGTLPDHLATGEERFLIEMTSDEQVWIDILAFSRPNTRLARLGYPIMKRAQRRFGQESLKKMREVIQRATSHPVAAEQSLCSALPSPEASQLGH